ncbi:MAG: phosphoenolpyruvate--protein phosphotransferase [Deltaproteobacteria bacterium]|nr:phosphoenolpyruvate--protein phosphotransferase [Deltaproteobacteria bacterium]
MIRLGGECASRGIAIGPAHLLEVRVVIAEQRILRSDREAECARLEGAVVAADGQLDRLNLQLDGEHSGEGHDLIEAHRLMLRSPELAGEARRLIADECLAAEWAVSRALAHIRSIFSRLDDAYFRERSGDFEVVGERLLRVLMGLPERRPGAAAPRGGIAVGIDISPLDPFHLHRAEIAGMVSESGGPTSHAAIVARAFGMPYVVGVEGLSSKVRPGATLIVDGTHGEVIVDPDEDVLRAYRLRVDDLRQRTQRLESTRSLPAMTSDGVRIHLAANVETVAGISTALSAGAESIGLFRTEFLYLEREDFPSEQEQYEDAVSALHDAGGIPVTFRTLDLGGDKLPLAMKIPTGPNPALGIRSVRFLLRRPEVLRRQLRALYRAASVGPLRFMFPLVSGVGELKQLRTVCDDVRAELANDRIAHDPATALGVMIETPSAVLTADHLARRCDFLSVGTNDLMQYTFAADRENDAVAHLYQPLHPAVLRTLKSLAGSAQTADVPISICGDMAGDPFLTWILIGLGFRDLSMDPDRIPLVKAVVRGSSLSEAEALTAEALKLETEIEVSDLLESRLGLRFASEMEGFRPRTATSVRQNPIGTALRAGGGRDGLRNAGTRPAV